MQEVENAKIAVPMIPMWLTFIVCGIVSSTGNTYFVEQAKRMDSRIGKWKLPQQVLLLILLSAKGVFKRFIQKYLTSPSFGISVAMIFSILCCIAAALVQNMRLNIIRSHHVLDQPKTTICMSVFWLTFQFTLLARLDSFLEESVAKFYQDEAPESMTENHVDEELKSMTKHLECFVIIVYGLGFMCNVLVVYVVGEVSKKFDSKRSWFQYMYKSHLDRYFWVLAALSSVNLIVFIVVALSYRFKDRPGQRNGDRQVEIGVRPDIPNTMING